MEAGRHGGLREWRCALPLQACPEGHGSIRISGGPRRRLRRSALRPHPPQQSHPETHEGSAGKGAQARGRMERLPHPRRRPAHSDLAQWRADRGLHRDRPDRRDHRHHRRSDPRQFNRDRALQGHRHHRADRRARNRTGGQGDVVRRKNPRRLDSLQPRGWEGQRRQFKRRKGLVSPRWRDSLRGQAEGLPPHQQRLRELSAASRVALGRQADQQRRAAAQDRPRPPLANLHRGPSHA